MYQSPYAPVGQWFRQPLESLHCRPPAPLLAWLLHPGSLTAALRQLSANRFRVQVLDQRWAQPNLEERRELGLRNRQLALVREVLLYGNDTPWVYARSVLPEQTLRGPARQLRHLDSRPLGELLFSEPGIRRDPIVLNRQRRNPQCALPELAGESELAWGRRSTFWLHRRPLLVAETFLQAFDPDCPPMAGRQPGRGQNT
ncbi:chorismate--pyruvate lyase family protein [Microbulbifer sp. YPW16]|uniref:chorismate--pyruvate lyase family protein n=1 Tax=Microbulbifer sp. YPW16 TaxID=2904242 RepID=UPI001E473A0E|nr:chorismate lyase [Microbulbifer sp. YPW16]UHQ53927.1 chorismate lyase [Microbulbifer sp. YPW16]